MSSILDSLEAAYNEIAALKAECERQHVLIVKLNQEVERQRVWLRNNAEMLDGKQERIDELLAQQGDLCESNNARQDEIDRLRAALAAAKAEARELACKFNTCSVQCEHDVCALVRHILAYERGEKCASA